MALTARQANGAGATHPLGTLPPRPGRGRALRTRPAAPGLLSPGLYLPEASGSQRPYSPPSHGAADMSFQKF